jgi:hydroxyacylglutathione hydrolase
MVSNLNVAWIHGSPECAAAEPPIQVHRFDAGTFILRQSKCSEPGTPDNPGPSFEAPFMYLLVGSDRALLLDTGGSAAASACPVAATVLNLLTDHDATANRPRSPLVVAHSHSHRDHFAGDGQFTGVQRVTIVPPNLDAVTAFFGLPRWPDGIATMDLGGRVLSVIPIPGHEASHVAIYDHATQFLLTGDTLYPGLLVINDWDAYVRSVARLTHFCDTHAPSMILGAHIEMTDRPGRWFGLGALFQPGEHVLELTAHHLTELNDALRAIGNPPRTDRRADFIIWPSSDPMPGLHP